MGKYIYKLALSKYYSEYNICNDLSSNLVSMNSINLILFAESYAIEI